MTMVYKSFNEAARQRDSVSFPVPKGGTSGPRHPLLLREVSADGVVSHTTQYRRLLLVRPNRSIRPHYFRALYPF